MFNIGYKTFFAKTSKSMTCLRHDIKFVAMIIMYDIYRAWYKTLSHNHQVSDMFKTWYKTFLAKTIKPLTCLRHDINLLFGQDHQTFDMFKTWYKTFLAKGVKPPTYLRHGIKRFLAKTVKHPSCLRCDIKLF